MSQINQPSTRSSSPSESSQGARPVSAVTLRAPPPVEARQQFDAAMQRAQDDDDRTEPKRPTGNAGETRKPRGDDNDVDPRDTLGALGALTPFTHLPNGQLVPGAVAGGEALLGGAAAQIPVPTSRAGLGAETLAGQTIGGTRQFSMNIVAEQAALTLRMTQAGPAHWHLRLATDAATRQQLAPHVERLRDRLRERQGQGQHTADFDLEDDGTA